MSTKALGRLSIVLVVAAFATAVLASPASADIGYEADAYPAYLEEAEGPDLFVWKIPGVASYCLHGTGLYPQTLNGPVERLAAIAGDCGSGGTVEMKNCNLYFDPEAAQSGTFGIGPPGCGPIKLVDKFASKHSCITVASQYGSTQLENHNGTAGSGKDSLELFVRDKDLQYKDCGSETTYSDLEFMGEWELLAYTEEEYTGVRYSTNLTIPASIAAYSYPTKASGTGLNQFSIESGAMQFTCESSTLETTLTEATSKLGNVSAQYGNCSMYTPANGTKLTAAVLMNSCHYTVDVQNSGPPYSGKSGIACSTPGDGIIYQVYITGKFRNCLKVKPQEGLSGMSLSNVGLWQIGLDVEVGSVQYEKLNVCGSKVASDGVLSGDGTLSSGIFLMG